MKITAASFIYCNK